MPAQDEKRFTFRVPLKLYKKIKRAAEKERRSINRWLVVHIEEALKKTAQ